MPSPISIAVLAALLLSVAPAQARPGSALSTPADAVATVFAPYRGKPDATAVWERRVFTRDTAVLIAHWRKVAPRDGPDDLDDSDWLCGCQDWDAKAFRASVLSSRFAADDVVEMTIALELGGGDRHRLRLTFRREGGRWLLEEIVSRDFPRGLKAALRHSIAVESAGPRR